MQLKNQSRYFIMGNIMNLYRFRKKWRCYTYFYKEVHLKIRVK